MAEGGTLFLRRRPKCRWPAKLLRVLQENVLERLGGNRSIPIDMRIVRPPIATRQALLTAGCARRPLLPRQCLQYRPAGVTSASRHSRAAAGFLQRHGSHGGLSQAASIVCAPTTGRATCANCRMNERAVIAQPGQQYRDQAPAAQMTTPPLRVPSAPTTPQDLKLGPAVEALERGIISAALQETRATRARRRACWTSASARCGT